MRCKCGGEGVVLYKDFGGGLWLYKVRCKKCGCESKECDSVEEAKRVWCSWIK